jgi:hypothetical protein
MQIKHSNRNRFTLCAQKRRSKGKQGKMMELVRTRFLVSLSLVLAAGCSSNVCAG